MQTTVQAGGDFRVGFGIDLAKSDLAKREVWGWASMESPDKQGDIVDFGAAKDAFAQWFPIGNIREQHDPKRVIGKGIAYEPDETRRGIYLGVYISKSADGENAMTKIREGVLKGFSIGGVALPGGTSAEVVKTDQGMRTFNRITKMRLSEVSIVDNPANPEAMITLVKADVAGGDDLVIKGALVDTGRGAPGAPLAKADGASTEADTDTTDEGAADAKDTQVLIEKAIRDATATFRTAVEENMSGAFGARVAGAATTASAASPFAKGTATVGDAPSAGKPSLVPGGGDSTGGKAGGVPTSIEANGSMDANGDPISEEEKDRAAGAQGSATGDGKAIPDKGQPRQAVAPLKKADGDDDDSDDDGDDKDKGDRAPEFKAKSKRKDDDEDDEDEDRHEKADLASEIRKMVADAMAPFQEALDESARLIRAAQATRPAAPTATTTTPAAATLLAKADAPAARKPAPVAANEGEVAFTKVDFESALEKAMGTVAERVTHEVTGLVSSLGERLKKLEDQPATPLNPAPLVRPIRVEKSLGGEGALAGSSAAMKRLETQQAFDVVLQKADNPYTRQEIGKLAALEIIKADMVGR